MNKDEYAIGIEIVKLCIKASLLDSRLKPIDNLKLCVDDINPHTKDFGVGVKSVSEKCVDIVERLIKKSGIPSNSIKAIGIGGGPKFVSVATSIEKKFKIGTLYSDNAACAAAGEKFLNLEISAVEDLLYIYSDLGAGVVLQGEKVKALPAEESKYLMPWDASFSMSEIAKREVVRGVGTKIVAVAGGRVENIDGSVVSEAARQNDEVALNIVHSVGVNLGMRIAYLVNLLSLQAVILGGGFEKTEQLLVEPITTIIKKLALKSKSESLKIISGRAGEDAVSIGAASLAVREISWPRSETSALKQAPWLD